VPVGAGHAGQAAPSRGGRPAPRTSRKTRVTFSAMERSIKPWRDPPARPSEKAVARLKLRFQRVTRRWEWRARRRRFWRGLGITTTTLAILSRGTRKRSGARRATIATRAITNRPDTPQLLVRLATPPRLGSACRHGGFDWHTVAGYGVLIVECKGCGRRSANYQEVIEPPGSFHGDRRILSDISPGVGEPGSSVPVQRSGNPPY
jgi:hypothetical protein